MLLGLTNSTDTTKLTQTHKGSDETVVSGTNFGGSRCHGSTCGQAKGSLHGKPHFSTGVFLNMCLSPSGERTLGATKTNCSQGERSAPPPQKQRRTTTIFCHKGGQPAGGGGKRKERPLPTVQTYLGSYATSAPPLSSHRPKVQKSETLRRRRAPLSFRRIVSHLNVENASAPLEQQCQCKLCRFWFPSERLTLPSKKGVCRRATTVSAQSGW